MLILPEDHPSHFTIAAIDPGSRFLGFSILHVDPRTLKILSSEAWTVQVLKLIREDHPMSLQYGHRYARLNELGTDLVSRFNYHRPDYIVSESAYYNPRTPGAYGPLIECIQTERDAVVEYNPLMPLNIIEPSAIKAAIGVSGRAKKEPVLERVLQLPLNYIGRAPMRQLSEHAIDSLAIGYAFYLSLLKELK